MSVQIVDLDERYLILTEQVRESSTRSQLVWDLFINGALNMLVWMRMLVCKTRFLVSLSQFLCPNPPPS